MAKPLTRTEADTIYDLQHDFPKKLDAYRTKKKKEFSEGKINDLNDEYIRLKGYIEGCMNGTIPDVLINIQFAQAKIGVLETLLKKK